jgi:hypothetical protein
MSKGFWWGILKEREHWLDSDVDGRIKIRYMEGRDEHRVLVG